MRLYDRAGKLIPVGAKLGSGGEGDVYAVSDHRNLALKVYNKAHVPTAGKAEKLQRMVALGTPDLLGLAAWPVEVALDRLGGSVAGLLMPKIEGYKPVHLLYGPKSRQREFPDAQWPFLVHTAANVARAFATVHAHGHVVGDVNHGNLLVNAHGIAKFIDCDSFQVHAGGRHYLCEVGVSTHTPPELQGVSFKSVQRTPGHDAFGLAVMVFQLLMMGRHPFSGGYLGAGEMPLEQAIRDHRFAYGPNAATRQMRQPPGTLDLAALGPAANLFERAFGRLAVRPSAVEWRDALVSLLGSLAQCRNNPSHHHLKSLPSCPWCAVERQSGLVFFLFTASNFGQATGRFDLAGVWARIGAVKVPVPAAMPDPVKFPSSPSPAIRDARDARRNKLVAAWVIALVAVLSGLGVGGGGGFLIAIIGIAAAIGVGTRDDDPALAAMRNEVRQAQEAYDTFARRLADTTGPTGYRAKLLELEKLKAEYEALPRRRQESLAKLERERHQQQLDAYLDRFRLDAATISGIGDGRKATLQSYGIETAADVDRSRILSIPGFGPSLTGRLVEWRKKLAARFVFDPNKGVDPALITKMDNELLRRQQQLEAALLKGEAELRAAAIQAEAARTAMLTQAEAIARRLAQAKADASLI